MTKRDAALPQDTRSCQGRWSRDSGGTSQPSAKALAVYFSRDFDGTLAALVGQRTAHGYSLYTGDLPFLEGRSVSCLYTGQR